jgi:hypothetical protein
LQVIFGDDARFGLILWCSKDGRGDGVCSGGWGG